jgi:biotin carboxyl carrier protein
MPGVILDVMVKEGQRVREGQTLLVMEAMKMEHRILASKPGEIISVNFTKGERVDMGATLVELGE